MAISLKTHKMIWGRSGNMCAFPECKKILVVDETSTDDPSVIGEEAHIVAQKPEGPRGDSDLTIEQRDMFDNLILLCSIHHKIVDDQANEYSVETLKNFKSNHIKFVNDNLLVDKVKIKDDERYATYIEHFITLTDLHNWNIWTSWILGSSEIFPKSIFESLRQVPDYIVGRIWPHRYIALENSMINFKSVLNDLFNVYFKYADEKRSDGYTARRFYKDYYRENRNDVEYNYEDEQVALTKYTYHVQLIIDLVIELTRAANYVCDEIRNSIFESFRIEEGALLITSSDFLSSNTYRSEYRGKERVMFPYPGLRQFMVDRELRDLNFGVGVEEDYFLKMPWEL